METCNYFFSYSRNDSEFVFKLATDLKNRGINVWLDQLNISPGARWDDAIQTALKDSGCMLVVISNTSIQSPNVLDEISYALAKGKRLIPLVIHNCDVPFRIARLQHIDFTGDYNTALQRLLSTLDVKPDGNNQATQQHAISGKGSSDEEMRVSSSLIKIPTWKKVLLVSFILVIIAAIVFFLRPGGNQKMGVAENMPATDSATNPGSSKRDSSLNTQPVKPITNVGLSDSAKNLRLRIYVHFLKSEQDKIVPVISQLRNRGYFVKPTAVVSGGLGNKIVVRYHYDQDKPEAEQLLKTLYELGSLPPAGEVRRSPQGETRRRHYDVWLTYK